MSDPASAKTLVEQAERVSLRKSEDMALSFGELAPRYRVMSPLGEGGMGEVHLMRDAVVGRDVAMKRVRGNFGFDEFARERFLREARVQGQLEHPSIVPVYDLAMTPDRRLYFTMRRIIGRTLDDCARGAVKLTRHALLSAMSRVCLAVDFAHAHGVVHRDIKPNNVMIGDYGEVYVLDWGLAKLTNAVDSDVTDASGSLLTRDDSGNTTIGSVLGTPGYMSPEQGRGEPIDERTDVYALGACLYEVLAGEPLFEIGPVEAMMKATLAGANAHLSERVPEREVPVELEAICVRATQTSREDRFQSAREISEAIERFLEGDRDLIRRRARAREHAAAALSLTRTALGGGANDTRARSEAMREVGRALANDPDNADARRAMVRLLTEPPRTIPDDVREEIVTEREKSIATARRLAALAFLSALLPTMLALWMGVRDVFWFVFGVITMVSGAFAAAAPARAFLRERRIVVMAIGVLVVVAMSRVASPLVAVPVTGVSLGVGLALFPRRTSVWGAIIASLAAISLPLVLEWTGVLPRTFHFENDKLVIDGQLAHLRQLPTMVWFFANIAPLATTCFYLTYVRDRLLDAEQRIRLQAWQLRQIVP